LGLVLVAAYGGGCGSGDASKPELPASVSPGWSRGDLQRSAAPAGLPLSAAPPVCWKAEYKGEGAVSVWVCGYRAGASAFDAVQRMPAAPSEVKFQKGLYLVVVRWAQVSQAGITALVGAIQRSLP